MLIYGLNSLKVFYYEYKSFLRFLTSQRTVCLGLAVMFPASSWISTLNGTEFPFSTAIEVSFGVTWRECGTPGKHGKNQEMVPQSKNSPSLNPSCSCPASSHKLQCALSVFKIDFEAELYSPVISQPEKLRWVRSFGLPLLKHLTIKIS